MGQQERAAEMVAEGRAVYSHLSAFMLNEYESYILERKRPHDFLLAVMVNDLAGVLSYGDPSNIAMLHDYYRLFYNFAPGNCWKSVDIVNAYLKGDEDEHN